MTTITPGTFTARFLMRGLSRDASNCMHTPE
jgi:hypothetical protein